jgi:hypothetical protein
MEMKARLQVLAGGKLRMYLRNSGQPTRDESPGVGSGMRIND